jgi:ketosteroid isomerase-like protein
MHANETLIKTFYESFQKRDYKGMAACYHPEVHFYDEAFQDLKGWEAGAMWQMLCTNAKDLDIVVSGISADDSKGRAHWDATYTFSATGRKVFNQIDATFTFKDGKIIDHRDKFDFKKWLGMAFGLMGKLLGGTSFLQNKVRSTAKKNFRAFIEKNNLGPRA